jgi:hypothetical protein
LPPDPKAVDTTAAVPGLAFGEPPRPVALATKLDVIFGSGARQIAWLAFAILSLFSAGFVMNSDISGIYFTGELERAEGTVTAVEETGASVNEETVMAVEFAVELGSATHRAWSYGTQRVPRMGDTVRVEWPAGRTELMRIRGMRRAEFGPGTVFTFLFPLAALAVLAYFLWRSLRAIRLFRDGLLARGLMTGKEPTNTTINDRRVFAYTFRFEDRKGVSHEHVVKTHDPSHILDEGRELLLYDPYAPDFALLLDELPGHPRPDETGVLRSRTLLGVFPYLLVPGLVMLGFVVVTAIAIAMQLFPAP